MSPSNGEEKTEVVVVDSTADGAARAAEIDRHFSDEEKKLREKLEHRAIILKEKKYFVEREARIEQWRASGRIFFVGPSKEDLALAKMMSTNLAEFGKQWQLRKDEEERVARAEAEESRQQQEELARLRQAAKEAEQRKNEAAEAARKAEAEAKARKLADKEEALRRAKERESQLQKEAVEAERKAREAALVAKKEAEDRQLQNGHRMLDAFSGRWSGSNNSTGYYECLEILVDSKSFSASLFCFSSEAKTIERFGGTINPPRLELSCYKLEVLLSPFYKQFHPGNFSGTLSNDFRTLSGVWTYPDTGQRSYVVLTKSGQ